MNTKRNNGDEQQPFIPAGHGKESGQYTSKTFYDDFIEREGCTKEELKKLLTKEEYKAIKKYSNYIYGCALNKAIREGTCTYENVQTASAIISAIKKHKLKGEIKVYRGITVTEETYIQNFYNKYVNKETITGSIICSTSRKLKRAIEAISTNNENVIGIIFETILPKGYEALPIETIARKKKEKEILINKPFYTIVSIETGYLNNRMVKKNQNSFTRR